MDHDQALREALRAFLVSKELLAIARAEHDRTAAALAALMAPPADLAAQLRDELDRQQLL